jgi:hypothetical protein
MRALWLYGEFTRNMKFNDQDHLNKVVEYSYGCLIHDTHLPVRLTAALSMTKLLQDDRACDLLKP